MHGLLDSFLSQSIEDRCFDFRVTVGGNVMVTEVIGHDQYQVRAVCLRSCESRDIELEKNDVGESDSFPHDFLGPFGIHHGNGFPQEIDAAGREVA